MTNTRILYVGPYRGRGGSARAAAENVLALHEAGAEVVCRPTFAGPGWPPPDPLLADLERHAFSSYDVVVQHVNPAHFVRVGASRNVGILSPHAFPVHRPLVNRAELLDLVLTPSAEAAAWYGGSPGATPGKVRPCPFPCNTARYARGYARPKVFDEFVGGGRFLFYFVGRLGRRHNVAGLLRAYFAEFRGHESVGLVVKTWAPGATPGVARRAFDGVVAEVLRGGAYGPVPPVHALTDYVQEDEVMALHQACHCFVRPGHASGWGYAAFDAMAMGRTPIVTRTGGYAEYLDLEAGWSLGGRMEPAYGDDGASTGRQDWVAPDPAELRKAMRVAFLNFSAGMAEDGAGLERAELFSRAAVGPRLLKVLTDAEGQGRLEIPP